MIKLRRYLWFGTCGSTTLSALSLSKGLSPLATVFFISGSYAPQPKAIETWLTGIATALTL